MVGPIGWRRDGEGCHLSCGGTPSPGDHPFQLDVDREAEERSDQDDDAQDQGLLDRGLDRDRLHDVRDDEDFDAEEDGPADL